ncbi:MAG: HAD-IA family hydrolase [Candidatus Rokubacteria bacterium]|nr:HAD-IA family hydrolase [Candidatus Rokubacteria bacterium]
MPLPPRPRALLFDAGNTLLRMNYAAIVGELARHGVRVAPEDLQRAERRARVRLDAEVLAQGASTETVDTAFRYLAYALEGVGVTDAAIVDAVGAWRREYNRPVGLFNVPDPVAADALRLARGAGLVTGVISNSNGSVRDLMERLGLAAHLDFVLDSFEVGVEKPDPRIFRLALEHARVAPDEAVYVGDLYSVDVLGARRAGIAAILMDPDGCWGPRDCDAAPDVLAGVRLVLARAATPPSPRA